MFVKRVPSQSKTPHIIHYFVVVIELVSGRCNTGVPRLARVAKYRSVANSVDNASSTLRETSFTQDGFGKADFFQSFQALFGCFNNTAHAQAKTATSFDIPDVSGCPFWAYNQMTFVDFQSKAIRSAKIDHITGPPVTALTCLISGKWGQRISNFEPTPLLRGSKKAYLQVLIEVGYRSINFLAAWDIP